MDREPGRIYHREGLPPLRPWQATQTMARGAHGSSNRRYGGAFPTRGAPRRRVYALRLRQLRQRRLEPLRLATVATKTRAARGCFSFFTLATRQVLSQLYLF